MKKLLLTVIAVFFLLQTTTLSMAAEKVKLETSLGNIVIELNAQKAPKTVKNFKAYVNSGFFNGTIFHRVIKGFMVQGGGWNSDLKRKRTNPPIKNEADNGLKNNRGTIAMARTPIPHSATSQFFINTANNNALNFRKKNKEGWGYCVFGKVVEGMDVVDKIERTPTTMKAGNYDVPVKTITIKKVTLIKADK